MGFLISKLSLSLCKTKKWQKLQKSPTNDEKKQAVGFWSLNNFFSLWNVFEQGQKNYGILLQQLKESVKKEYNNIA